MIEPKLLIMLTLSLNAIVACGQTVDRAGSYTVTDSLVVYSEFPPSELSPWIFDSQPSIVIGAVQGELEYEFARVVGVVRHRDGYLVADGMSGEIRRFDGEGLYLETVGGGGEGPGEFGQLRWIGKSVDDAIFAWDLGNRRLTGFSRDLQLIGTWPLAIDEFYVVAGVFTDGDLLLWPFDKLPPERRATARVVESTSHFAAVDLNAPGVLDTIVQLRSRPSHVTPEDVVVRVPFTVDPNIAVGGSSVWAGNGSDGTLARFDRRGVKDLEVVIPLGDRISDADVEGYVDRDLEGHSGPGRTARAALLRAAAIAVELPSYDRLLVDSRENVWVRSFLMVDDVTQTWTVLGPHGEALGLVRIPRPLEIHFVYEDQVVGVWRDPLGVETVRVHQVDRH